MQEDKHTYNVAITKVCGDIVVLPTVAESKWEAEERMHSRHIGEQPDRGAYSATRVKLNAKYRTRGVL